MLYSLTLALIWPALALTRLAKGESLGDLGERLGRGAGKGPALWLHGASNGELASARWLVEDILAARPGLRLVVTSNTATGRAMVRGWGLAGVTAALAPMDLRFALRGFLRRHQPLALISLEAELWPNRFALCAARKLPVLMLGARMSEHSFRAWLRQGSLAQNALAGVRLFSAQDPASRERHLALGLPAASVAPDVDLKAEAVAARPPPQHRPRAERAGWLLAASTHDGEEEIVLDAFSGSDLTHLILAPRHPRRGDAIAAMLRKRGIAFQRRSQGALPGVEPVFLADTMGEMDDWYARCGICFVGGTLADKGGHNPWEPARHGCALLHGPSLRNFAGPFAALAKAGGAVPVSDAATLAQALKAMTVPRQEALAQAAERLLVAPGRGAVLVQAILKQLGP